MPPRLGCLPKGGPSNHYPPMNDAVWECWGRTRRWRNTAAPVTGLPRRRATGCIAAAAPARRPPRPQPLRIRVGWPPADQQAVARGRAAPTEATRPPRLARVATAQAARHPCMDAHSAAVDPSSCSADRVGHSVARPAPRAWAPPGSAASRAPRSRRVGSTPRAAACRGIHGRWRRTGRPCGRGARTRQRAAAASHRLRHARGA